MKDLNSHLSSPKTLMVAGALLLSAALTVVSLAAQPTEPTPPKDPPPEAKRTASGLASLVLVEGTGEYHPDPNDQVVAHFILRTAEGNVVQSSYDAEKPAQFDLQTVFPGWREGLQLMVSGEKRRLWIPAHLAPKDPKGGPSGAVIIDVEVMGILKVPNLRADFQKPPADAERTESGAFTKVLQKGEGDHHPIPGESVLTMFSGWDTRGRMFSSSVQRGRATMFLVDRVMPAFSECLQRMVVGEKRMCWVPGNVAAGQWPDAPPGMLIFEIELMQVFEENKVTVEQQKPGGASPQP
ncbi:MAG: peptidylprolyl isomerase [bacterium]|nr:peptidylprolyl isomerase [bacterium]